MRPRSSLSLAGRLTLLFSLAAFLLLATFSAFIFWVLSRNLDREDDEFLTARLQSVAALVATDSLGLTALDRESDRCFLKVQDRMGRTVFETPNRPSHCRTLIETTPSGWRIEAAMNPREDDAFRGDFARMTALALLLGTAASAGLGYGVARRGLRPVRQIAEAVGSIGADDLTQRIGVQGWPGELTVLAASFDGLLTHLDESFARLSQFSADMAHELRTPLANLRGEAEVALTKSRTPEEYQCTLASALEEYEKLAQLIDSLLFLARAENPEASLQKKCLDAHQEAERIAEFYRPLALEKGVSLCVEGSGILYADTELLGRALANLLENALTHTPRSGTVTIHAAAGEVSISDTGCGIAPEHLPHLFERLYRADPARSGRGSGLGLALVATIAQLHGGSAKAESELGKGTRVTITLPYDPITSKMTNKMTKM